MKRAILRLAIAPLCAAATSACCGSNCSGLLDGEREATVFLRQAGPAEVVMEALYTGIVRRDAEGCLRLDSDGSEVVIWPHDARMVSLGDVLHIETGDGRNVGQIGGTFSVGGGFVPAATFEDLSDADRAVAESRCPSANYWVVGDPIAGD